jgi:ParB family chromosome partitioning protein
MNDRNPKNQSRRSALGRGLSALIPEAAESNPHGTGGVGTLPINQIRAADHQPRSQFHQDRIVALSESIKIDGILQPIVVRRVGHATFAIIAGERRYRAAKLAGLTSVPIIIREATENEAFELAMIENVQREDLNPIEEAEAYSYLSKERGLSHEAIAERMGRDRVTITNTLRLLKLQSGIRHYVAQGQLTAGHARALLMAPTEQQLSLANRVIKSGLSVRKTETAAKALRANIDPTSSQTAESTPAHRAVEDQLRTALGAPVKLVQKKGVGRLEIRFHSMDELERLIDMIATLKDT